LAERIGGDLFATWDIARSGLAVSMAGPTVLLAYLVAAVLALALTYAAVEVAAYRIATEALARASRPWGARLVTHGRLAADADTTGEPGPGLSEGHCS
jgi:L-asparagine transporter-like permease